ncbi:MAG: hypothetical protein RID59_19395, partial [Hoeflea sp.]
VDDVLTSGATSKACVEALLEAGAKDVVIACFARVVDAGGLGGAPAKTGAQERDAGEQGGRRGDEVGTKNTTPEAITAPGAT